MCVASAQATVFTPRPDTDSGAVASALGVSSSQAAADLSVQQLAFTTIQTLIASGDSVWFDDRSAELHIYDPAPGVRVSPSLPADVAAHVVYDQVKPVYQAPDATARPVACTKKYLGCTPVQDGVEMYRSSPVGKRCTAGWVLEGYSGGTYMLTAGHCATWGTTWYSNPFSVNTSAGEECVPGASITGNAGWSGHDWAIESLSGACGGVWGAVHDFKKNEDFLQQGAVQAYVGETVCHYGITTPERCGKVTATNISAVIAYESGNYTVQHLDEVCALAQPGDSGGPVSDHTYRGAATGIVIAAGSGSTCNAKGDFFLEGEIFPILEETNTYVYS
jgi:hypothetical protein